MRSSDGRIEFKICRLSVTRTEEIKKYDSVSPVISYPDEVEIAFVMDGG